MRGWINLFENAGQSVHTKDVLAYLQNPDYDTHRGWLGRAYNTLAGQIPHDFLAMLDAEVQEQKAALPRESTLVLYRGMRHESNGECGIHWTDCPEVAKGFGEQMSSIEVSADDVDWVATIARRISWPKEREITLKKEFAAAQSQQLTEAVQVPDTEYGYWVSPTGKIIPVEFWGHTRVLSAQGVRGFMAGFKLGWVRIICEGTTRMSVEARYGNVSDATLRSLVALIRHYDPQVVLDMDGDHKTFLDGDAALRYIREKRKLPEA